DCLADVDRCDLLEPAPAGNAVDLQDVDLAARAGEQVHAGDLRTDGACGTETQLFPGGRECRRLGPSAPRQVGAPVVGATPHRGHNAIADHERADVSTLMGNSALNVINAPLHFQRAEDAVGDLLVADAHHPAAVRAEERLDHDVAHLAERGE